MFAAHIEKALRWLTFVLTILKKHFVYLKRKFYEDGEEDGDSLEDSDDGLVAVKPIDSFF